MIIKTKTMISINIQIESKWLTVQNNYLTPFFFFFDHPPHLFNPSPPPPPPTSTIHLCSPPPPPTSLNPVFCIVSWILMNFMAKQIFAEIEVDLPPVTQNEHTGSSSYSFNWGGGKIRWGEWGTEKTRNFSRRSEKRSVSKLVFYWSELLHLFRKLESFSINTKMYIPKLSFILYWTIIFCLPPTPPTLLSQPTPRFAGIYSLKTNLSTFEN